MTGSLCTTPAAGADAERTLEELPGTGHALLRADLGEPGAAERLVAEAVDALGTVDVLVNNAAVAPAADTLHPVTDRSRSGSGCGGGWWTSTSSVPPT